MAISQDWQVQLCISMYYFLHLQEKNICLNIVFRNIKASIFNSIIISKYNYYSCSIQQSRLMFLWRNVKARVFISPSLVPFFYFTNKRTNRCTKTSKFVTFWMMAGQDEKQYPFYVMIKSTDTSLIRWKSVMFKVKLQLRESSLYPARRDKLHQLSSVFWSRLFQFQTEKEHCRFDRNSTPDI